jgi:glycosyltransferase involved in cell wall biosynthesis
MNASLILPLLAGFIQPSQFPLLTSILLGIWLLTLANTIASLVAAPRLHDGDSPGHRPRISVLIPARDEERTIARTVRALLAQTYDALEIIVVNDRSTDATAEVLDSIRDERLRVVQGVEPPEGWLGKPWALHEASLEATGQWLLFVDADIVYAPGAIAAAMAYVERRGVAMISLLPRIEMRGFWEHLAMPNLATMVFSVMPLWLANRSRLRLLAAGGGPGNLVKRTAYDSAGGHEALKNAVIDDVALARLIRGDGNRTEMVVASDLVSVRMYDGLRETVDGFTKNAFSVFGRSYAALACIIAYTLIVHVVPYALALTGDRIALVAVCALTLTRIILFAALRYRLDNAVLGDVPMVLLWVFIFLRSAWITGVRGELRWRGRRYDAAKTKFGAG